MTGLRSRSSSSKHTKLEVDEVATHNSLDSEEAEILEPNQDDSEDSCSICLHSIADRTVIPICSHEFCFECLLVWTEQSRRCPLCSQAIGEYLIHSIRSRYDYRKHYLTPLRTSPLPSRPVQTNAVLQTTRQRRRRQREWGTRARESDEADKLERSIAKRRWIYRYDLYAKHVASNAYTKYRPYPTTAQFAASQDLISRTTTFLRRELQIWEGLDVEFLTTLIISLMKSIDIRSESAVKLISEFLDMDAPYTLGGRHVNAEHFAHEVYSYVRSPYKDLFVYDTVVQYDAPSHLPQHTDIERPQRWREPSPIRLPDRPSTNERRSQKRSRSGSSERSPSWSPSGRKYSPTRKTGGSDGRRTLVSRHNSRSPRPIYNVPTSSGKRRRNGEDNLDNASQLPVASPLNEPEKEPPILSVRDVKGKRKADEIEITTSLTDETKSEIVEPDLNNELYDRTRNATPIKIIRVPRNRTLLDSVKAHLAVSGETARQDPVPSLLTRLSNAPDKLSANSTKAHNMSGNSQQYAGDNDHARHPQKNSLHHDDSNNTNPLGPHELRRPLSSRSQDSKQSGPNCSARAGKKKPPTSSNNSHVSVNIINRSPLITMSSARQPRPVIRQNSMETLTTVEANTMTIPSYQRIPSRSLPVPSSSQNQFHDQQTPHAQSPLSIDAVGSNFPNISEGLAHSTCLNSVETRTRLLARLEIEKQQAATEDNHRLHDSPSCSSTRKSDPIDCDVPSNPDERDPNVLDLASDSLVSEESRKRESKLRTRAQLRVRLAAEKRLFG